MLFLLEESLGHIFFENSDGVRETVKQSHYQYIENYFVPKLKELVGNGSENQIFMQDGVSPHTAKATPEKTFRRKNNNL